jgi:glyoxylase-like metal-dependent hydrolase (beta-lactamase superfamily II)
MDRKTDTLCFRVGSVECVAISDGSFTYPTANFFPGAPPDALAQAFGAAGVPEQIISPYTCLAVEAEGRWVLLDTGAAGMGPTTGHLRTNLETAGIKVSDIATVILTHAHPDHIGGVIGADGRLSFPEAQLYMTKQEWDFWSQPDLLNRLPCHLPEMARERQTRTFLSRFPVLKQKVKLVEQEAEVARGIRVQLAPGHTPGHAIVKLRSGREILMYISDTVLHPIHLVHPDWRPVYDMDQDEAEKTRRSTLSQIASEGMLVFAFHFQFPAVGHIRSKGEAWSWEPISEGMF